MAKKTVKTSDTTPELAFEEALSQLEDIVREMESEQLPLDQLIQHYEQGTLLFRACEKLLSAAEGRIELIRKTARGETVLESFAHDSDEPAPPGASTHPVSRPSGTHQEDGELF